MSSTDGFTVPRAGLAGAVARDALARKRLGMMQSAQAAAQTTTPDDHALALDLAKQTGSDPRAAAAAVRVDKPKAAAVSDDLFGIASRRPKLADWLSDPHNFTLAQDDIANIKRLHDASASHGGNALLDYTVGAIAGGAVDIDSGMAAIAGLSGMDADTAAGWLSASEQARPAAPEAVQRGEFLPRIAYGAVSSLPAMAGALGLGAAVGAAETPVAAGVGAAFGLAPGAVVGAGLGFVSGATLGTVAGFTLSGAGSRALAMLREAGVDTTDRQALKDAFNSPNLRSRINSAIWGPAGMSAAAMTAVMHYFPPGLSTVAGEGLAGKAVGFAAGTVKQGAAQLAGTIAGHAAGDKAPDPKEAIIEALATGAAFEAGGAAFRGVRGIIERKGPEAARAHVEAVQALVDHQGLSEAVEAAGTSKTRTRNQERFEDLAQASASETPTVYIDREGWDRIQTAAGKLPAVEAERLTGDTAAYDQAKATGRLEVPYGRAMGRLPDDPLAEQLLEHATVRPGGPTLAQVAEAQQAALEAVKKEAEAAKPDPATLAAEAAADEARQSELEAQVGLKPGDALLFQSAQEPGQRNGQVTDATSNQVPTQQDVTAAKSEDKQAAESNSASKALRDTAAAIEAAPKAPGVVGRLLGREASPQAQAVRDSLGPQRVPDAGIAAEGTAAGGTSTAAPTTPIEAVAAAAQRDPAGTAAALRELADIGDRRSGRQTETQRQTAKFEAALRSVGRPVREAKAVARILSAFVSTMRARFPEVPAAKWDALMVRFAKGEVVANDALLQTAYHGSPHEFEAFSLHKIGTGEGAQAYGWGLYFAGERSVADYYRRAGAPSYLSKVARDYAVLARDHVVATEGVSGDAIKPAAIKYLVYRAVGAGVPADMRQTFYDAANNFDTLIAGDYGKLYTVDLSPAEDEYLLWDKPLAEQSEKVRKALASLGVHSRAEMFRNIREGGLQEANPEGRTIYSKLGEIGGRTAGGPESASKALAAAGIPGIKYLDAGSRGAGEGSFNYVIFDDKLVKITRMEQRPPGGDARGAYSRLTRTIHLFETADGSTAVHEIGHYIRDVLGTLAADPESPQALRDMHAEIERAVGAEPGEVADYGRAGGEVSGLSVGKDIPNTGSISSSFNEGEYETLPGIREVPLSAFENTAPKDLFYAADDLRRVEALAAEIKASGRIDPLIVAIDEKGPYILEGAHRLGALHLLGKESFPALVIVEDSARAKPAELTTAQEEKFARLFETYIREGTAPSPALHRAFAVMRDLLKQVYLTVRELIGADKIPEDTRALFDRMLATDAEIEAAQRERGPQPLMTLDEATAAGIKPEDYDRFVKPAIAAADAARDTLTRKVMADLKRETQAERKATRARLEDEERKRLAETPAFKAVESVKLDRAAVKEQGYDPKQLEQFLSDDGISPQAAAELFGFDSGGALVDALVANADREAVVRASAGARMAREFPELYLDPERKRAEARRALDTGESRGKLVDAEIREMLLLGAKRERIQRPETQRADKAEKRAAAGVDRELQAALERAAKAVSDEKAANEAYTKAFVEGREAGRAEGAAPVEGLIRKLEKARDAAIAERIAAEDAIVKRRLAFSGVISRDTAREFAAANLADKSVREIKPGAYLAAVGRERTAAAGRAKIGEYEEAARHLSQSRVNEELFREARRLLDDAAKSVKRMRYLATPAAQETLGRAGFTYKDQANAILNRYALAKETLKDIDAASKTAEWIASVKEETGREPVIPASVRARSQQTHYTAVTPAELADAREAVDSIYKIARTKDKLLKSVAGREIAEAAGAILDTTAKYNKAVRQPRVMSETDAEKQSAKWDAVAKSGFKVPQLAREMDGGLDGGPAWDVLVRPLNDAADARRETNLGLDAERVRLNEKFLTPEEIKGLKEKRHVPGVREDVSLADRLVVMLNMGNDGNLSRLQGRVDPATGERTGGTITPAEVQAIVGQSTVNHWRWVQGIAALYEGLKADSFALEERTSGATPKSVEPRPFTVRTADGVDIDLPGWYFPIRYAGLKGEEMAGMDAAKELGKAVTARSMTRHGHLKDRLDFVGHPLKIDLSVIDQSLSQIVLDLTHREALIDAQRVLKHPDTLAAIHGYFGKGTYDQFRTAFADIATDDMRHVEQADWAINRLRRGTSAAILGVKLTTSLVNVTGFTQSIQRIGGTDGSIDGVLWFGSAMRRTANPMDSARIGEWINDQSSLMRHRTDNLTREIGERAKAVSGAEHSKLDGFNYYLYGRTQVMLDRPTWLGMYDKAISKGEPHERAVAMADSAVREASGTGDIIDLSAVQRGSAWKKLSTVFYGYANVTLNRASESWRRLEARDPATYGRFVADQLLLFAVPALASSAMWAAVGALRGDKKRENLGVEVAKDTAANIMGLVPYVRQVAGLFYGGDPSDPSDRAVKSLADVLKAPLQVAGVVEGKPSALKAVEGVNMLAGIWIGYPADQINKMIEGFAAMMDGKANVSSLVLGKPRR